MTMTGFGSRRRNQLSEKHKNVKKQFYKQYTKIIISKCIKTVGVYIEFKQL